ncbi:hypothetical protein [Microlunatus spumicola]|uniref:hypothetical protein n=1 Tax=Microlunatus spumicola TaxID=81499 RepID=UPI0019575056
MRDAWPGCVAAGAFVGDDFSGPPGAVVGSVPEGFVARSAVLCSREERPDAQDGQVLTELERTSTAVGPLLTYLARPSEEPTDDPCPAIGIGRPWLFLLDASGRYLVPAIPTDACGLPLGWSDERQAWETVPYADRVLGPSRHR